MSVVAELAKRTDGHATEADVAQMAAIDAAERMRMASLERGIRELKKDNQTKTSAEAIADQAVTLLERANAHIREQTDALQRKLDDLRRMQNEHMMQAEASIRAAMAWNEYMAKSVANIDSAIESARGDLAKLTKS